jgi:prepilin-type N-terminal cleavage/methylation domain-containing protein
MVRKAFTLVELLVVIAIISLLISILAPSLNLAKDIAKQVVCSSNENSVGKGMLMYGEVNSDKYPPYTMSFKNGAPYTPTYFTKVERTMWASMTTEKDPVTLKQKFRGVGIIYNAGFITSPRLFYCPAQTNNWFVYDEYIYNRRVQPNVLMPWGSWDNWSNFTRVGYWFNAWGKLYGTQWDIAFRTFSSMENDKALMIDQSVLPWAISVHTARGGYYKPTFNVMFNDAHVEPRTSSVIMDILLVNWGAALKIWEQGGPNNDWHDIYTLINKEL